MMCIKRLGLFLLFVGSLCSCSGINPLELPKKYETIRGKLASEPELASGGSRLYVYVLIESEVDKTSELVVCLAANQENKEILTETKGLMMAAINEPIFLYVSKFKGNREIIGGVDYQIYAAAVYVANAHKNRVILIGYGDSLRDAMKSMSWTNFIQKIIRKGLESAL